MRHSEGSGEWVLMILLVFGLPISGGRSILFIAKAYIWSRVLLSVVALLGGFGGPYGMEKLSNAE